MNSSSQVIVSSAPTARTRAEITALMAEHSAAVREASERLRWQTMTLLAHTRRQNDQPTDRLVIKRELDGIRARLNALYKLYDDL